MARFIVENRLTDPDEPFAPFDTGGYAHEPSLSEPGKPAFLRRASGRGRRLSGCAAGVRPRMRAVCAVRSVPGIRFLEGGLAAPRSPRPGISLSTWHRAYRRPTSRAASLSISIPFSAAASWYQRLRQFPAEAPQVSSCRCSARPCGRPNARAACGTRRPRASGSFVCSSIAMSSVAIGLRPRQSAAPRSSIGASLLPHAVCASSVPIRSLRTSTSPHGAGPSAPRAGPAHRRADGPNRAGCFAHAQVRLGVEPREKRQGEARVGGIEARPHATASAGGPGIAA